MRTGRPRFRVALVLVGALLLPGAPAWAHADYRDSDPSDGASVSAPPGTIWAEFTEEPAEGSTLVVTDPCGRRVDHADYSYEPFPINRVHVSMTGSSAGEYAVTWTVISDVDSHTTRGTFTFTSSGGDPCPRSGAGQKAREKTATGSNAEGTEAPVASVGAPARGDEPVTRSKESRGGGRKGSRVKNRPLLAQDRPRQEGVDLEPAREEDIPLDWLVVGLLISALIGAAGGRVYAHILGPRDPGA